MTERGRLQLGVLVGVAALFFTSVWAADPAPISYQHERDEEDCDTRAVALATHDGLLYVLTDCLVEEEEGDSIYFHTDVVVACFEPNSGGLLGECVLRGASRGRYPYSRA